MIQHSVHFNRLVLVFSQPPGYHLHIKFFLYVTGHGV